MEIRMLGKQELLPALHLVWEVFAEDVAPTYPREGVEEFQKFIKYDHILSLYQKREIIFFGAFEEEKMLGTIAVRNSGHISLFFVKKEEQKKGVGRKLYNVACDFCARQLRITRLTVNAAPEAAVIYQHLGMLQTGPEQQVNGICFVPMEMYLHIYEDPAKKAEKQKKTRWIVGGIIVGVILLIALTVAGVFLLREIYDEVKDNNTDVIEEWENEDPMNPDGSFWEDRGDANSDDDDDSGAEVTGSDAIPAYIAPKLSYELQEETYVYSNQETKNAVVEFEVNYPKLKGLDSDVQKKINKTIKECAMKSVDEMYNNPTTEFKEKILGIQTPMIASQVTYKVCYADENFISILFEDAGMQGSQNDYYQHLRTLNIGLSDGKGYEVKDIVQLDDEFIEDWLEEMRDEADNDRFLSELSRKEMKETLSGKDIDGNYVVNFFVDADGVEIGYDLNYPQGDENDLGYSWVTAPFDFDDMDEYAINEDFWSFFY